MRIMHGVAINDGDYLMDQTGKPTKPIEITDGDRAGVHESIAWLERGDPGR